MLFRSSSVPVSEPSEQSVRRLVSEAESAGTSSSCPSKPAEQSGSTSSGWKQSMFPLWRARPLGDEMSEEGSPAAVRPQCPAKQNVSQPRAGNRSQLRYNHGRLNHLEAEAVQVLMMSSAPSLKQRYAHPRSKIWVNGRKSMTPMN